MYSTEKSFSPLMWVTWHHVFRYSVTAVAVTVCLPSHSLTMAISLAVLFHLSGIMSQYNKFICNLCFSPHFISMQSSSDEMYWLLNVPGIGSLQQNK
jgi:hypothetical protein